MATYDKEWIIQYVENELPEAERLNFEAELQRDPALAAETARYRELRDVLRERLAEDATGDALKATLGEMNKRYFEQETPSGLKALSASSTRARGAKVRRLVSYAAGLAAAAAVIGIIFIRRGGGEDYLQQLGQTQMISNTERGDRSDTVLQQAAEYFNAGQFDKVVPLLNEVIKTDSGSQLALFYRGVAEWHMGRLAPARTDLKKVFGNGSALQYESAFYLALTYASEKDKADALAWLGKIPEGTPVSEKAKTLINKLQ
jgi:negative regulator of sigma E activity